MSGPKPVRGKTAGLTAKLSALKELPGRLKLGKLASRVFSVDCFHKATPTGVDGTSQGSTERQAVRFGLSADPFMTAMRFSQRMPHPGLVLTASTPVRTQKTEVGDPDSTTTKTSPLSNKEYFAMKMKRTFHITAFGSSGSGNDGAESQIRAQQLLLPENYVQKAMEQLSQGQFRAFEMAWGQYRDALNTAEYQMGDAAYSEPLKTAFAQHNTAINDLLRERTLFGRLFEVKTDRDLYSIITGIGWTGRSKKDVDRIRGNNELYRGVIEKRGLDVSLSRIGESKLQEARALFEELKDTPLTGEQIWDTHPFFMLELTLKSVQLSENGLALLEMDQLAAEFGGIRSEIESMIESLLER